MRRAAPPAAGSSEPQQQGLHPEHPDYDKRMEDAQQRAEVAAAHFRDNPEGGRPGGAFWAVVGGVLLRAVGDASELAATSDGTAACRGSITMHAFLHIPSHNLIMQ